MSDGPPDADQPPDASLDTVLERLFAVVLERKAGRGATNAEGRSYVQSLLAAGAPKISGKLVEEACELAQALTLEDPQRVASETADLLFHVLVALAHREVPLRAIAGELARRMGKSGIDEKHGRPTKPA